MLRISYANLEPLVEKYSAAFIEEIKTTRHLLDYLNEWCCDNIGITFEDVLRSGVEELRIIARHLKRIELSNPGFASKDSTIVLLLDIYKKFAAESVGVSGADGSRLTSYRLVADLGITHCPYCNSATIANSKVKFRGPQKKWAQIDHFHDKVTFPLLSLSFFNLVPSCARCNKEKFTHTIKTHPHEFRDILLDLNFSFEGDLEDKDSLAVKIHPKRGMKRNCNVFKIKDRYDNEKVLLQSSLIKMQSHSLTAINDFYAQNPDIVSGLFKPIEVHFTFISEPSRFGEQQFSFLLFCLIRQFYRGHT